MSFNTSEGLGGTGVENGEKGQETIKPEQPWSMRGERVGGGTLRPVRREGATGFSAFPRQQASFMKAPDL